MLSRRPFLILSATAALCAPALALAETPEPIKPSDGVISLDDARRIAAQNGVARVEQIRFDDGRWKIEGRDSLGSEIELDLRGSDGTVIKMGRERPASAKASP